VEQPILTPVVAEREKKQGVPGCLTAFGYPREFRTNRFVYTVVSSRARGLSVGINMTPDGLCNYDCLYCEVNRAAPPTGSKLDVEVMAGELHKLLADIAHDKLRKCPRYHSLPGELLQLRHVTLSGDGEPTLAPDFAEAVEAVVHLRALGEFPFFKMVLVTNATGLDLPAVRAGLAHFTEADEIWAKLDGGTQAYLDRLARPRGVTVDKVLSNILTVSRRRPVVIQSLFPAINGEEPAAAEIEAYAQRLKQLKDAGARISLVQIYSAMRPTARPQCGHLPLKTLSHIAHTVRQVTGLPAEVF
jgi:wyosine [tRNA(Phe)-imidazoG37] synthetase (radical SAM superfamily)